MSPSAPRPPAVIWSERVGLTAALLGGFREALLWNVRVGLDGPVLAFLFTAAVPILVGVFVLLTTRRRSRVALIIMIAMLALAWLTTAKLGLTNGSLAFTIGAASLILHTLGVALMLTPGAWQWMRKNG